MEANYTVPCQSRIYGISLLPVYTNKWHGFCQKHHIYCGYQNIWIITCKNGRHIQKANSTNEEIIYEQ